MAKIYYDLIISGDITIDDVPAKYQKEVEEMLKNGK